MKKNPLGIESRNLHFKDVYEVILFIIFIFRERKQKQKKGPEGEEERGRGRGGGERERINLKRAPRPVWSPKRGLISQP